MFYFYIWNNKFSNDRHLQFHIDKHFLNLEYIFYLQAAENRAFVYFYRNGWSRAVSDLDFVSVFNFWAQHEKTLLLLTI
jgi:hypothetical protein